MIIILYHVLLAVTLPVVTRLPSRELRNEAWSVLVAVTPEDLRYRTR